MSCTVCDQITGNRQTDGNEAGNEKVRELWMMRVMNRQRPIDGHVCDDIAEMAAKPNARPSQSFSEAVQVKVM